MMSKISIDVVIKVKKDGKITKIKKSTGYHDLELTSIDKDIKFAVAKILEELHS